MIAEVPSRGLAFRGLVKRFGSKEVLAGVDLTIEPGSVQFVIGISGAGKSVLMKHVVGLIRADDGRIYFEGEDITDFQEHQFYGVRRRCSYVFQHSTLLDALDILDNVALPIQQRFEVDLPAARLRAAQELERLHLGPWARRFPSELGAGLKKRAAIARSIALEPSYLIYDEPTTGLDPVGARLVDRLILELRDRGVTQIVVSHDLTSILGVADRIAMLHSGRVHFVGTPAAIRACADPVVQQFVDGSPEGPL
ncbi:MAG: ATP-binding cassette domain-containing protein [Deltaproteobacteria bacterium]|nr:ATP-binding cassette domain-containing protein [Deltaproteobacteria bacterium]